MTTDTVAGHAGDRLTPAARHRLTVVLGLLTALGPFTIDLYLPAFPAVALSLATSATAIQATLAGTTLGIAIGQLIMGPWSDRIGRRAPLIIATSAHVLASLACAIAPDVTWLTIARFVMGAAAAAGGVVAAAMVRDLYSGLPMMKLSSRLAMINGAAPIIAPVLGSVLLVWVDWRGIFVVLAVYAAIVVASTVAFIPESLPRDLRSRGGFREFGSIARGLFSDRIFVMLMVVGGMVWGSEFTYLAGSSFLLQDGYGFSATTYGLVFAVNAVGYVAGTQLGARIAHRIAPQRLLAISTSIMVLAAVGVIVGTTVGSQAGVLVALWFSVAAVGVSVPCATALALNRITRNAGTAAAMIGAVNFGIAALVTPLASLGSGGDAAAGGSMGIIMLITSCIAVALALPLTRMAVGWPTRSP